MTRSVITFKVRVGFSGKRSSNASNARENRDATVRNRRVNNPGNRSRVFPDCPIKRVEAGTAPRRPT